MKFGYFLATIIVMSSDIYSQTNDDTIVDRAFGQDVTDEVLRQIHRSRIFDDDRSFLRRLAYVESHSGEDDDTFRDGYFGGIWQLGLSEYQETKNSMLSNFHLDILDNWGVDWTASFSEWKDLLKPIYSGLGARLFLETLPQKIPETLSEQAAYWYRYYNKNESLTEADFIRAVEELEETNCGGKLDLSIVLDGSGSIGATDFAKAKVFVANLTYTFQLEHTRIGLIVYSGLVDTIIPLDNNYTLEEIAKMISDMKYPGSSTFTGAAMQKSIEEFNAASNRSGIPRILAVFTDGASHDPNVVKTAAAKAGENNIVTYSIGIGSNINQAELLTIAQGDTDHVYNRKDYNGLSEFYKQFNKETCNVPQKPELNETVEDSLPKEEKRYYEYQLPSKGATIKISEKKGSILGYYSYTVELPSSAMYDGIISEGEAYVPPPPSGGRNIRLVSTTTNPTRLFISILGRDDSNEYTIEGVPGDARYPCYSHSSAEDECFSVKQNCSYCYDPGYLQDRCHYQVDHVQNRCNNMCSADLSLTPGDNKNCILQIQPGFKKNISVTFKLTSHQLDLYYLMDVSGSMGDDKANLITLSSRLIGTVGNITSDFLIGYGSFVDKPKVPFGDPVYDYSFRNNLPLTSETDEFRRHIEDVEIHDGMDLPESSSDAIYQVAKCTDRIGWRNNSRRVLLLATDAKMHVAGDGSAGGIVTPFNGECKLDRRGYYEGELRFDYPSVDQLVSVTSENKITVVFAATAEVQEYYETLSSKFNPSVVGVLNPDSSNIVELLEQVFKDIQSKLELEKPVKPNELGLRFFSNCNRNDGIEEETSLCDKLQGKDEVTFTIEIDLKNCPSGSNPNRTAKIHVSPLGLPEQVEITMRYICQ